MHCFEIIDNIENNIIYKRNFVYQQRFDKIIQGFFFMNFQYLIVFIVFFSASRRIKSINVLALTSYIQTTIVMFSIGFSIKKAFALFMKMRSLIKFIVEIEIERFMVKFRKLTIQQLSNLMDGKFNDEFDDKSQIYRSETIRLL